MIHACRRRIGCALGIVLAAGLADRPADAQSHPAASASRPATSAPADLNPVLEEIRARHGLPALGGAIVAHGELVAVGAVGMRAAGSREPVQVDDLWHLGSCTKAMTATLIGILVEQGKLRWDTTLAEVFPDIRERMHADYRAVTLEQLLSHRGGVPSDLNIDGLWSRLWRFSGSPTDARLALLEGVVGRAPAYPPGTKMIYANGGYAIAGAMAERVTGKPWEELMRRMLFEPLGMKNAGFAAPGSADTIDQPRGHRGRDTDVTPVAPGLGADNPVAIGPAGIVHASLADWARFVALHVGGERADAPGPHLLKPETMQRLHKAVGDDHYALGWVVTERPWGGRVLNHNGSNTLWYCVAWLAPDKDFAVIVTCNRAGPPAEKGCDDAAGALIRFHARP